MPGSILGSLAPERCDQFEPTPLSCRGQPFGVQTSRRNDLNALESKRSKQMCKMK